MVVVVRDLVQEGARLQYECRQHHLGQVHARPDLLHEEPDDGLVLLTELFGLVSGLEEKYYFCPASLHSSTHRAKHFRRVLCVVGVGGQHIDVLQHGVLLAGLAPVLLRGVSGGLSESPANVGVLLAGERPSLLKVSFEVFLHLVLSQGHRPVSRVLQALQFTVKY